MSNLLYSATRRALTNYADTMLALDIELRAELPEGPKLFVANHPTTSDPALLTLVTRERIHTLITELVFGMPVIGHAIQAAGHVRVVRSNGRQAFNQALELLDTGHNVAIFPEGALSPVDGGVYPLRNGAARLALATGATVVPVGIALDPDRIHRVDISRMYLDGPYAMTVGMPLTFDGHVSDRKRVIAASGKIRHEIIRLAWQSGQRIGIAQQALVQPSHSWARAAGVMA